MEYYTSIYDGFMAPFEKRGLRDIREKIIKKAHGDVLEIGPGTGANLEFYDFDQINSLTLLEPEFNDEIIEKINNYKINNLVNKCICDTQDIPFEDNRFDVVIFTLVFCSVEDPVKGFNEIKRVLKDNGEFIFIEHVEPLDEPLKSLFNLATPLWKKIAGGCHLNRNTLDNMKEAGLDIEFHKYFFKNAFVYGYGRIS